jgi:aspartate/tyrosine/aromatic aminotransferase
MFDNLTARGADAFALLIQRAAADRRPHRVDLGVGVYIDANGQVPIPVAVERAERQLLEQPGRSKTYPPMPGDAAFCAAIQGLLLGDQTASVAVCQTLGASGALRLLTDLFEAAAPAGTRLWLPTPTWPNHEPLTRPRAMPRQSYRFLDAAGTGFDLAQVADSLSGARPGDIVLLHLCCHNPTGIDPDASQFAGLADLLAARGLIPFVDMAYAGYGGGLEADLARLRLLADAVPEMAVAFSGSKTFGLYRDRIGAAVVCTPASAAAGAALSVMLDRVRESYSMPPGQGAAIVTQILSDTALRREWTEGLEAARQRLSRLRIALSASLSHVGEPALGKAMAGQCGMFAVIKMETAAIDTLADRHAIHVGPGGRINLSGLPEDRMDEIAEHLIAAHRGGLG